MGSYGRMFFVLTFFYLLVVSFSTVCFFSTVVDQRQDSKIWDIKIFYITVFFLWFFLIFIDVGGGLYIRSGYSLQRTETFFEPLVSNYLIGIAAVIFCILYEEIIKKFSPRNQYYVDIAYLFIFLYSFSFLIYSDINLNFAYDTIDLSIGNPLQKFTGLMQILGPYTLYGLAMVGVLGGWYNCLVNLLNNND